MTRTEIQKQIAAIDREYEKVAGLLAAAQRRMGESWDKPSGVQARNAQTVAKHRAALRRLDAKANALETE